jgi:poly(glycerol-phosphate) alpha-glucosyltransferase
MLARRRPSLDIAMVLVGEGEEQARLETEIEALGLPVMSEDSGEIVGPRIVFYPFQQLDRTPLFFARAEAFILPSSSEEWGLVVNEAMACSTPVLVSKNAGCAIDLVVEGKTGFVFDPEKLEELVGLLERFVDDPSLRDVLGRQGFERISHWKPAFFGQQGVKALCAACAIPSGQKNVVFLVESLATRCGGTALEVATIAPALASFTSHKVQVVTGCDEGPHLAVDDAIRLIKLHGNQLSLRWLGAVWRLRKILLTTDVLFVTGIWGPMDGLALKLALTARTRLYIRVCGMLQPYILNRNPMKKFLGRRLYVDSNLNRAAGLIVNSLLEKDQVASLHFRSPSVIIRNGVSPPKITAVRDVARSRLNISKEERVLLYLGRIHPKKGLHHLLAAMLAFTSTQSDRRLPKLLVGGSFFDEEYKTEIMELIGRLPASNAVILAGEVTGQEKEDLFAAADVFILPSASEGLPNAVLEAMTRGLPCIITHGCNLPEVAMYGAGLVIDAKEDELIAALDWTAGPLEPLRQASQMAVNLITREFSLEKTVKQYDELIVGQ